MGGPWPGSSATAPIPRRRRRAAAVRVTSIALVRSALGPRTRWVRLLPSLLLLAGLALLGVGAARPQATVPVASDSTTIMLAMDVSGSMCSTDVDPNRLTVAQEAAKRFIEAVVGSGGRLVAHDRLDAETVAEILDETESE